MNRPLLYAILADVSSAISLLLLRIYSRFLAAFALEHAVGVNSDLVVILNFNRLTLLILFLSHKRMLNGS